MSLLVLHGIALFVVFFEFTIGKFFSLRASISGSSSSIAGFSTFSSTTSSSDVSSTVSSSGFPSSASSSAVSIAAGS
uniref:Putative ovule protein n=1 Tax=Solanum chacoense TaxID=4108 RepID=A0A0V0GMK9_SOLCH